MEVSDAKWPFFAITFTMVFALGLMIARLERTVVMQQWPTRRCEIPVMMAAAFFRPDSDPRTNTAFAADNFEFCMKSVVESFIGLLAAPIHALFGKHMSAAGDAVNAMGAIRDVIQRLHTAFMSYVSTNFKKFYAATFEMSRIVQEVKMALGKLNAVAMSMVYAGISLWRGILNAIQFVIKVVLIICAIMLVLLILLWFILLPVMPLIVKTLVVIISAVVAFAGLMDQSLVNKASSQLAGFCFAEGTRVDTPDGPVPVEEIRVGQALQGGRAVTAVITVLGEGVPLYDLCGIHVSGSHRVQGEDGVWKLVEEDTRARPIPRRCRVLYCFNTTDNVIPVCTPSGSTVAFRDWEELGNTDANGQYIWNYIVSVMLNKGTDYHQWKDNLRGHCEDALASMDVPVHVEGGWMPIGDIELGQTILDRHGAPQRVLGIIEESVYGPVGTWHTEWYEDCEGMWLVRATAGRRGDHVEQRGRALITETGEVVVWYDEAARVIRDFTEVGADRIHETYGFLAARLKKSP
jgi:hypothetical protein